jgi:hypothetical protein
MDRTFSWITPTATFTLSAKSMDGSTPSFVSLSTITIGLRDPADLALIRRALMQLPRLDPDCSTAVMELLLHIHDTEQHHSQDLPKFFF